MRSEFEKLPQIESHLHNVVFDEGSNEYLTKKMGHLPFEFSEWFLNGSWTIYQHQQAKIDELQRRNQMLNDNIKEQGHKLAYQNEVIETQAEKLLGLRDEKAELQKRVDALELTIKGAVTFVDLQIEATEQGREAAIGTQAKNWWSSKLLMLRPIRRVLEQALKGGLNE